MAFAIWLGDKTNKVMSELRIAIGTDPRITGNSLKAAIAKGIFSLGTQVADVGLASTPAMFMSTQFPEFSMDGAIMITASHLPFNRNGMKFFTQTGGLDKPDVSQIIELAEEGAFSKGRNNGKIEKPDLMTTYSEHLRQGIILGINHPLHKEEPLSGFKIVVDAGNGSGGFFVEQVLKPLGADTNGSQFLEPDGMFPNHIPNPENTEAINSICRAVTDQHADLGIIFDTDVDRTAFVDSSGSPISRNSLIALVSSIIIGKNPDSWIVTDSITSDGLTYFIEKKLHGHHHRFKRGYRNVINEAIRLNKDGKECHLAIETSGHAAIKKNQWLDDGAYLATLILAKMVKMNLEKKGSLSDLISELPHPAESKEFRIKIFETNFIGYGKKIIQDLKDFVKQTKGWSVVPNNYEGIRIRCDKDNGEGWFLLRLSLHDPVLPLNVESELPGGIEKIMKNLLAFLDRYKKIDKTALEVFRQ
jgi:phosphomannomutase